MKLLNNLKEKICSSEFVFTSCIILVSIAFIYGALFLPCFAPGYIVIYLDGGIKEVEIVSGYKWSNGNIDLVLKDGRKIKVSSYLSYREKDNQVEKETK